jgi:hypothetical protein
MSGSALWHARCRNDLVPGWRSAAGVQRDICTGGRGADVKITVEIDELEAGVRTSHAVADYVRAMLKVRSLRRAVGEALLEVEHCKRKLRAPQLADAQKLLEAVEPARLRPRLLRRLAKRPARQGGE